MDSLNEEDDHVIEEDKTKGKAQKANTSWNQKKHIPQVSLLLWHEMVTVCCFVWPLAL